LVEGQSNGWLQTNIPDPERLGPEGFETQDLVAKASEEARETAKVEVRRAV